MIRWLWKIIVGKPDPQVPQTCQRECQWVELQQLNELSWDGKTPCSVIYVLKCAACGDLKNHRAPS